MKKLFILNTIALIFPMLTLASPLEMGGLIPFHDGKLQASDLHLENEILTPEQQKCLTTDSKNLLPDDVTCLIKNKFDVSAVNPDKNTKLWSDQIGQPLDPQNYKLNLPPVAEFNYVTDVLSPIGIYRFAISGVDKQGVTRNYSVVLGKTARNMLLRKALLEKVGYHVPEVQVSPLLRLKFKGALEKKTFYCNIQKNAYGAQNRWVINPELNKVESSVLCTPPPDPKSGKDAEDAYNKYVEAMNLISKNDFLDIQDLVLFNYTETYYNLGGGYLIPEVIQGRRLLNAPLVAFSLTDVPESLNTFSWTPGRITNESVYLPYFKLDAFSPSFQDAQWIARRIAKLTRKDFEEIVTAAKLPKEVSLLLVEKLISRRNLMNQLFKVRADFIPFDNKISSGNSLVSGKLTQKEWPGYASQFSFGDPASPISKDEIVAFFKSRLFSTLIDSGITGINNRINSDSRNNLQNAWLDHQYDLLKDQIVSYSHTGKFKNTPFQMYTIPTLNGGLILSREVVVGSYMGSDNLIQIADTFGYQITPGYYLGFDGVPSPAQMSGQAGLQILRTYSHVKPITSVQEALKEKYSNILVPYFKNQIAGDLSPIMNISSTPTKKEIDEKVKPLIDLLKNKLAVGESLIINDSYILGVNVVAGVPTGVTSALMTKMMNSTMNIKKIQILRKNENTIQVYYDPALANAFGLSAGLNVYGVPVITFSLNNTLGTVKTEYYSVNMDASYTVKEQQDPTKPIDENAPIVLNNPDAIKNLQTFYQVLNDSDVGIIRNSNKAITIKHSFNQNSFSLGLLFQQNKNHSVKDDIIVKDQNGEEKSFLYRTTGQRSGQDYQTLVLNSLDALIANQTGFKDFKLDGTNSGNPGDTIFGNAVTRSATLEAEQVSNDPNGAIAESYVQIMYRHNGWELSNKDANEILSKYNKLYGSELTWPAMLNDTEKLQLYVINLKIAVFNDGIEHLARVSPEEIKLALQKAIKLEFPRTTTMNSTNGDLKIRPNSAYRTDFYRNFITLQQKYLKAQAAGNGQEQAEAAIQLVAIAELYFPGRQLIPLVGGEDNILIEPRIQGFRKGDETAADPKTDYISGNTIGIIGSRKVIGPIHFVQSHLEISEGEFFAAWLINRL